jgi:hypothetical protein
VRKIFPPYYGQKDNTKYNKISFISSIKKHLIIFRKKKLLCYTKKEQKKSSYQCQVGPNLPEKSIFLCFSAKHDSFDINLENRLIANRLCKRRFFT